MLYNKGLVRKVSILHENGLLPLTTVLYYQDYLDLFDEFGPCAEKLPSLKRFVLGLTYSEFFTDSDATDEDLYNAEVHRQKILTELGIDSLTLSKDVQDFYGNSSANVELCLRPYDKEAQDCLNSIKNLMKTKGIVPRLIALNYQHHNELFKEHGVFASGHLTPQERFTLFLAWSEFLADSSNNASLVACEVYREYVLKELGIDNSLDFLQEIDQHLKQEIVLFENY